MNVGKRVSRLKKFVRDTRGISDAVAVMLFVSMAIVIAAVIGSMALSQAPSGSAPVAQLSIYGTNGKIIIDHRGGDAINPSDIRILVYDLSSGGIVDQPINNPTIDVDSDSNNIFNVGDKIVLDTSDLPSLNDGGYEVRVVFVPLNKPIADNNVFVSS